MEAEVFIKFTLQLLFLNNYIYVFIINFIFKLNSYYRSTSMKTINELGVIFTSAGSYCLGKIQIQQMPMII